MTTTPGAPLGAAPHVSVGDFMTVARSTMQHLLQTREALTILYDIEGAARAGQHGMLVRQTRALLRSGIDRYLWRVHLVEHAREVQNAGKALQPLLRQRCLGEIFGSDSEPCREAWRLECLLPDPGVPCEAYVDEVWAFLGRWLGLPRPASLDDAVEEFQRDAQAAVPLFQSEAFRRISREQGAAGFDFSLFGASVITADGLAPLWTVAAPDGAAAVR